MKKLPDRELLCYSYIAFRPWNHLERAKHHWNCAKRYFVLFVGRRYYLRPIIPWNVRSTIGTARRAFGTCEAPLELPEGQLERAKHHWNARRAYF